MCLSGAIGLCMLYRLLYLMEAFPSVSEKHTEGNDASTGYLYKWLPIFTSPTNAAGVDIETELLSVRPLDRDSQYKHHMQLMAAAGMLQVYALPAAYHRRIARNRHHHRRLR